jgi:hypothetical protein
MVRQCYDWAQERQDLWSVTIWRQGQSRFHLRHDAYIARLQEARILLNPRVDRTEDATAIFQELLRDPVNTQRYGGFLDIGTEAFLYLLSIAMDGATDRESAAANFSRLLDGESGWYWLNSANDFKETLGLQVRDRDWQEGVLPEDLRHFSNNTPDAFEWLGETSLEMGFNWGPPNWSPLNPFRGTLSNIDLCGTVSETNFTNLAGISISHATALRIHDALFNAGYIDEGGTIRPLITTRGRDRFIRDFHVNDDHGRPLPAAQIGAIWDLIQAARPSYVERVDILMRSFTYRLYNHRFAYSMVLQWANWQETESAGTE